MKVLDLSYSKITGIGIEERLEFLTHLDTLRLCGCRELTDEGMAEFLIVSGVKLRNLDLSRTFYRELF